MVKQMFLLFLIIGVVIGMKGGKEIFIEGATSFTLHNGGFFTDRYTHYEIWCGDVRCGAFPYEDVSYVIKKDLEDRNARNP